MHSDEVKLKQACQQQNSAKYSPQHAAKGLASDSGYIGRGLDEPCRVPLREQVAGSLSRSYRESRRVDQLAELQGLLDRNPEVARILDLLDIGLRG